MSSKSVVSTDQAPGAIGPYSQGIHAGDMLFVSGQLPLDPVSGELVEGDIKERMHRVCANALAVVAAAGGQVDNVVKTTIFLTDMNDFQAVNEVYGKYFTQAPPARSAIQVAGLPKGANVEMELIAWLG